MLRKALGGILDQFRDTGRQEQTQVGSLRLVGHPLPDLMNLIGLNAANPKKLLREVAGALV